MVFSTIETLQPYLATLDLRELTQSELDALVARCERLHGALLHDLGPVRISYDTLEQGSCAFFVFPPSALLDPANPYVLLNISRYGSLAGIAFEWDVAPSIVETIQRILDEHHFHFVSYHIFGNPEDHHWKYADAWASRTIPPPPGKGELQHAQVWADLFEYA